MGVWTGKLCARCGGKKGPKHANKKHCHRCSYAVKKEQSRAAHGKRIQALYGITREEYDALYAAQGGLCYICRRANGKSRRLSVDHDHETGVVRGLLCRPCNDMLGHARDSIEVFQRAIDYLKNPPAKAIL